MILRRMNKMNVGQGKPLAYPFGRFFRGQRMFKNSRVRCNANKAQYHYPCQCDATRTSQALIPPFTRFGVLREHYGRKYEG